MSILRRLPTYLFVCALLALAVPAQAAEPDLYLPSNADTVITVNVRQIIDSPLMANQQATLRKTLQSLGDAQKMLDDLGVDPFKDVDRLVLAKEESAGTNKVVFIIRGRFDARKLQDRADQMAQQKKDEFKMHQLGGYKVCEVKVPAAPIPILPPTLFVLALDNDVIVAAPNLGAIVEAVAKKEGKKKAEQKKEFQELLSRADARQSISIVSNANLGQGTLASITTITGGISIQDDVKTHLVVGTKEADDAKEMAELLDDLLNQAKALVGILAGKDYQKEVAVAVELLGNLKAEAQGAAVHVKGQVSKEFIEKTLK